MGDVCKPYISPAREDVFKMRVRLAVWNVSGALGRSWILWHVLDCPGMFRTFTAAFGMFRELLAALRQVLAGFGTKTGYGRIIAPNFAPF
jgi:hypothetical protein